MALSKASLQSKLLAVMVRRWFTFGSLLTGLIAVHAEAALSITLQGESGSSIVTARFSGADTIPLDGGGFSIGLSYLNISYDAIGGAFPSSGLTYPLVGDATIDNLDDTDVNDDPIPPLNIGTITLRSAVDIGTTTIPLDFIEVEFSDVLTFVQGDTLVLSGSATFDLGSLTFDDLNPGIGTATSPIPPLTEPMIVEIVNVPEPSLPVLLVLGSLGLRLRGRRR